MKVVAPGKVFEGVYEVFRCLPTADDIPSIGSIQCSNFSQKLAFQ
jgi:hypothetical protein